MSKRKKDRAEDLAPPADWLEEATGVLLLGPIKGICNGVIPWPQVVAIKLLCALEIEDVTPPMIQACKRDGLSLFWDNDVRTLHVTVSRCGVVQYFYIQDGRLLDSGTLPHSAFDRLRKLVRMVYPRTELDGNIVARLMNGNMRTIK